MLLLFALMLSSAICAQDYHVVLWDNTTAPTSNGLSGDEVESKPGQWKNTQTAEMWIYKAGDNATGQALVFFPGGGYSSLSVGNGHKEAQWFARNGITAAVVKYRLPNGHSEVPRNDADEALRVMRSMAAELNIDPAKVGVSGTSAGGYLAGSVGTLSDVKPGFMILFYPVILDDAVVYQCDVLRFGVVRMGVHVVRHAVRRPARMRDADASAQLLALEEMLQVGDLALTLVYVECTVLADHGDPRAVVSAVFEPVQTLQQNRTGLASPDISYNPTHSFSKFLSCQK